jgi:hypothetical protein
MNNLRVVAMLVIGCSTAWLVGCGGDDSDDDDSGSGGASGAKATAGTGGVRSAAGSGGAAGVALGSLQTPPQGADAVEAWLSEGSYKDWHCEDKLHASRAPSPHGFNRICSNDLISSHATGNADWPKGAAAVKELYAAADDTDPVGYAVYLKTDSDSAGGANWYWYERVPLDSAAPHDAKGVVADSLGDTAGAKSICVGCHIAAGSDSDHTPTSGGRDQVYTPVP